MRTNKVQDTSPRPHPFGEHESVVWRGTFLKGGHPVYSFVMHGRTIPEAVNWHRKYNEYGPTICDVIVLSEYEFIATFLGNYYGAIRFKAFPQGHDVRRVHKRKSKR